MASSHLVNSVQYGDLLNLLREVDYCRISSRHESVLIWSRVKNQSATRIRIRRDGPLLNERVVVGMRTLEDEGSAACSSAYLSLLMLIVFIETFATGSLIVTRKEPIFRVEAIGAERECPGWSATLRSKKIWGINRAISKLRTYPETENVREKRLCRQSYLLDTSRAQSYRGDISDPWLA